MINIFGELDNLDHEAMREGFAISRLNKYIGTRKAKVIVKKNNRKNVKSDEVDILRILNIIQGK
jgi:hypothetical protein